MNKLLKASVLGAVAATFVGGAALADDATLGIRSEPSSVDPYFHNLGPNNAMLGQIFGRLIDWSPDMARLFPGWRPHGSRSTIPRGNSSCVKALNSMMAATLPQTTLFSRLSAQTAM